MTERPPPRLVSMQDRSSAWSLTTNANVTESEIEPRSIPYQRAGTFLPLLRSGKKLSILVFWIRVADIFCSSQLFNFWKSSHYAMPDICYEGRSWNTHIYSRFTCLKIASLFTGSFQAVLFFFADSSRKKGFQPSKNPYFCWGQQKKEPQFWDM